MFYIFKKKSIQKNAQETFCTSLYNFIDLQ